MKLSNTGSITQDIIIHEKFLDKLKLYLQQFVQVHINSGYGVSKNAAHAAWKEIRELYRDSVVGTSNTDIIDTEFFARECAAEMNKYGSICNISEEDAMNIGVHCMWLYRIAEAFAKRDLQNDTKTSEKILKELHATMRGETIDEFSFVPDESRVRDLKEAFDKGYNSKEADPNGIEQHVPGAKLDANKPMADLLLDFSRALLSVAEVGTYGAHKYTRGGWQHVPDGVNRYTGALLRHLLQEKVEDLDQDTNLLHASHAAWNSLARLELLLRKREVNTNLHTTDTATRET